MLLRSLSHEEYQCLNISLEVGLPLMLKSVSQTGPTISAAMQSASISVLPGADVTLVRAAAKTIELVPVQREWGARYGLQSSVVYFILNQG